MMIYLTAATIGDSCANPTRSCAIPNAYCDGSFCQCSPGYYQASSTSCTLRKF